MKFVNPLPFVTDIDRSKRFYSDVLGLRVLEDHGDFVRYEDGFALHDAVSLHRTVFGQDPDDHAPYGRRNFVLYFEVEDIDAAFNRISSQVELIHPVETQAWGQRVFRLYDPDEHIVEVGEPQR
ncbi:MAG: VOC family protein [Geminicoccaceae bacterium]